MQYRNGVPPGGACGARGSTAVAALAGLLLACFALTASAKILVPMDLTQTDHLKAYGVAYHALQRGEEVEWLLNYRGGSFLLDDTAEGQRDCLVSGVTSEAAGGAATSAIYDEIERSNMEVVLLEKAPRVAIYAPPNNKNLPWDDAVNLALTYAEIPFDVIWDPDILDGKVSQYDWVHLHHEDFTGQYGKFFASYGSAPWYVEDQRLAEAAAHAAGFATVWQHKHAVARRLREFVAQGGFLFAMCSATDSYDVALAAGPVDIVDVPYDGTPPDPRAQERLDFTQTLAFENFHLEMNPIVYEFSDIDMTEAAVQRGQQADFFTLFDFSAKEDPVATMLTQCHVNVVPGFMGQTTSFRRSLLKKATVILAETEGADEVKYLHGNYGQGTFTFYGGHDPEDYQHKVGDPPTDLSLHKNSPGYRLILNNILFPAAEKKETEDLIAAGVPAAAGSGAKNGAPGASGAYADRRAPLRGGNGLTPCDPIPEHHGLGKAVEPRWTDCHGLPAGGCPWMGRPGCGRGSPGIRGGVDGSQGPVSRVQEVR